MSMARKLVYYCIVVLSGTLLWAIVMKTIDHGMDVSEILTYVSVAFGGELLLLCLKRVIEKKKSKNEGGEENGI